MNAMESDKKPSQNTQNLVKKTLKNVNDPQSSLRCGAKTRVGTPCKNFKVKGRPRCRMHGAFAGRPPDPKNQMVKFIKSQRKFIENNCIGCDQFNKKCFKIIYGKATEGKFEDLVEKYCQLAKSSRL